MSSWTTTQPTLEGFYWARGRDQSDYSKPLVVWIDVNNGRLTAFATGNEVDIDPSEFVAWSHRLQEPSNG